MAPQVRHSLKNVGDVTARSRFEAEPALELEPFLRQAVAMNRAGSVTKIGIPTSVKAVPEGAVFIERYKETCVLMVPPPSAAGASGRVLRADRPLRAAARRATGLSAAATRSHSRRP